MVSILGWLKWETPVTYNPRKLVNCYVAIAIYSNDYYTYTHTHTRHTTLLLSKQNAGNKSYPGGINKIITQIEIVRLL